MVKGLAAECIHGILTLEERTITLLAVARLLGTNERLALGMLMAEMAQ
jgi:hypothetical protein